MKEKIISLKELRQNMGKYAAEVQHGRTITVLKRSKPLFKLVRADNDDDDEKWKSIVDLTRVNPGGVPIDEVITALEELIREDGQAKKVSAKTPGQ